MTQVSLSVKQTQTHRRSEQSVAAKGEGAGEGWIGGVGLADRQLYRQ